MGILNIKEAEREGTRMLISVGGDSGSGKTYSALLMARGLVGENGKIGFLDTENRRGLMYGSDENIGSFLHADLKPPFTPERYVQAVREFEAAGVDVVIIDSGSHEWEGQGGILEQAETAGKGKQKWLRPKLNHKKFVQGLLNADIHVIVCLRTKRNLLERQGPNGKTEYYEGDQVEIQEKNFRYEMTVSMILSKENPGVAKLTKCPEFLTDAFFDVDRISIQTGKKLKELMGEVKKTPADIKFVRDMMFDAATQGSEVFKEKWKELNADQKKIAMDDIDNYKSICKEADALIDAGKDASEIENPFAED